MVGLSTFRHGARHASIGTQKALNSLIIGQGGAHGYTWHLSACIVLQTRKERLQLLASLEAEKTVELVYHDIHQAVEGIMKRLLSVHQHGFKRLWGYDQYARRMLERIGLY